MSKLENDCKGFINKRPFIFSVHQERIIQYFIKHPEIRGRLLYHKIETGKTCSSIRIADELLNRYPNQYKSVHVFVPNFLRSNFVSEYCSLCGQRPNDYRTRYKFWTYDTNNIQSQLENVNLDNSIIIVDKVDKIISEFFHGISRGIYIYNRLIKTKNAKLILLTATPIRQLPLELAYIFNLLYVNPSQRFDLLSS